MVKIHKNHTISTITTTNHTLDLQYKLQSKYPSLNIVLNENQNYLSSTSDISILEFIRF